MPPASDDRHELAAFWQRWLAGERVSVEQYLDQHPRLRSDSEAMLDIICSEYMARKSLGEQPAWEEFFVRFPQFNDLLRRQFEFHDAVDAVADLSDQPQLEIYLQESFPRSGRFVIHRRLGGGGMGEVFEALDTRYDTCVALKVLRNLSPSSIERFRQEFRVLANISHPNLVTHYELFHEEEHWFLTMELIAGVDFLSFVRFGNQPPIHNEVAPIRAADQWQRLQRALQQIAAGLETLHQHGVVHGDIKPSNVLVTPEERVVLLDFGFATSRVSVSAANQYESLAITRRYASPEQLAGGPATSQGDCYSLGVMLSELTHDSQAVGPAIPPIRYGQQSADGVLEAGMRILCRQLLDNDPARRPTARRLASGIRPAELAETSHHGTPEYFDEVEPLKPFVGRESELAALLAVAQSPTDAAHRADEIGRFTGRRTELAALLGDAEGFAVAS